MDETKILLQKFRISFINLNKNVTGLTSGKLDPNNKNDILIFSSLNSLSAYGISIDFF